MAHRVGRAGWSAPCVTLRKGRTRRTPDRREGVAPTPLLMVAFSPMVNLESQPREVSGPSLSPAEHAAIEQISQDPRYYPTSVAAPVAYELYSMVRASQPSGCVEVGCHLGFSTTYLAKALKENGRGRLYCFDLDTGRAAEHLAVADLSDWVQFEDGPSAERMELVLGGESNIELAFVDGDHTRRGCLGDFSVLLPRLALGAVVVVHDIYPDRCGWFGPRLLIECLEAARGRQGVAQFEVEERDDLDPFGIATCRLVGLGSDPVRVPGFREQALMRVLTSRVWARSERAWFQARRYRSAPLRELRKAVVKRIGRARAPKWPRGNRF